MIQGVKGIQKPSVFGGNYRSAACGRYSKVVSRKCPDFHATTWLEIGRHDGVCFCILFAAVGKKYAVADTFLAQSTVVDKKYAVGAESVQIIMDDAAFACCTLRAHRFPLYRLL